MGSNPIGYIIYRNKSPHGVMDSVRLFESLGLGSNPGEGIMAKVKDIIDQFCSEIEAGPDEEHLCRHCGQSYSVDDDCDPTALCHFCAQEFSAMAAAEIVRLRILE